MIRIRRTSGIEHLLVAGYIFLIPIGWSPFPWNIQWSEVLFAVLFVYVLRGVDLRRYAFYPMDLLVALYFLGPILSFTRTSDVGQSSIQFTKHLYLALVFGVFSVIASRSSYSKRIVSWFSLSASFLAAIGILSVIAYYLLDLGIPWIGRAMPIPYLGEVFRLHGTFHSEEFFGDYLTMALPLVMGLAMESERHEAKRGWWVCVACVVAASLFTVSHSLVGFLAAGTFYVWRALAAEQMRFLRVALVTLCVVVFVWVNAMSVVALRAITYERGTNPGIKAPSYVYAFHNSRTGTEMLTFSVSYNFMSYYLLKRIALEAFWREPLTGVGLGRFHEETERAYRDGKIHARYRRMDPHSTLPGRLAETGIIGGITLVLLWAGVVWSGFRLSGGVSKETWIIRAILAGLLGLLVNSVNADIMNFRFLWVGLALLRGMFSRMVPSDTGTLRLDRSGRTEAGYAPGS